MSEFEQYIHRDFQQSALAHTAEAPGRVDVMGGVSDYAGGLVLEGAIAERARVAVSPRRDDRVRIRSFGPEAAGGASAEWSLEDCIRGDPSRPLLRDKIEAQPSLRWSAYSAGVLSALCHFQPDLAERMSGWDIAIDSRVPSGAGVSSSAALEVATLKAVTAALKLNLTGLEAAKICQWAENHAAGAPCGIMDQVTCALAREGELLALLCQPCELRGSQRLPDGVTVSCINSNIKHSVGGSAYSSARVGAFMGLQLLRDSGLEPLPYLCTLTPEIFHARWEQLLPLTMSGGEFLDRHTYPDAATTVYPDRSYRVRPATAHPIYERRRVERFIRALARARETDNPARKCHALTTAGRQMYGSNWSYTNLLGLGSPETMVIVRLVRQLGPDQGFYGARITGGGSGGTVAVLHTQESAAKLEPITEKYREITGVAARILRGSSPGAWAAP